MPGVDQNRAPLYEALLKYRREKKVSFHVPGHKDGKWFDQEGEASFTSLLSLDGTEVNGLDDLHHPHEAIARAQELAAEAFGADATYFLVGGSTAGNLATSLTVFKPGDRVLVQRNSHKSVFNGLMLSGAEPIYVVPEVDQKEGIPLGIPPESIKEGLIQFPDVRGVWLTNPNYYGIGSNLKEIAKITRKANVPLLIDEAHGAHYGQAAGLPSSSLQEGADLVVQSTHKMLSAMTMASMLHVKGRRIDRERLTTFLSMVQSSSPSYPLMASLDLARRQLIQRGRKELQEKALLFHEKKEYFQGLFKNLTFFTLDSNEKDAQEQDPFKWMISAADGEMTGYELLESLEDLGCVAEMADTCHVVLAFSPGIGEEEMTLLQQALGKLDHIISTSRKKGLLRMEEFTSSMRGEPSGISLRKALDLPGKSLPLMESAGYYCGEMIIPYPPGVPYVVPGEKIEKYHIEALLQMKESGIFFQGIQDDSLATIRVVDFPGPEDRRG